MEKRVPFSPLRDTSLAFEGDTADSTNEKVKMGCNLQ